MLDNHFQRSGADFHSEPKIGRLFLLSLALHLVVVLVFSGAFTMQRSAPKRPVYYVDLTQLPVANPRAGRPDGQSGAARKGTEGPAAPQKIAPPVKNTAPPPPVPAPKAAKPASTTAKPTAKSSAGKTTAKPQTSPKTSADSAKSAATSGADYQTAMSAVEKLRRKQELAALKEKLAALASSDSRPGTATGTGGGNGSTAPLGMPDGTGDEIGVGQEMWLQERLRKNWSLSKYQVIRRDLEARVRITYNANGLLTGKEFLKPSGDSTFDDSVTKAILKSRQLEFNPGRQLQVVVIFNLKDLMD